MTTLELLNDLQARDIHLECVGDKLRVNAPSGAVTPELRAEMVAQKAALLELLALESAQSPTEGPMPAEEVQDATAPNISSECMRCGAPVESYSEDGYAYCNEHWVQHLLA